MTTPLDDSERAFKESLLRAGRSARPSDEARRRAMAASLALVASAPTRAAATGLLARLLGAGRWIGLSTVGVVAVGVTVAVTRPAPPDRAAATVTPVASSVAAALPSGNSIWNDVPAASSGKPIQNGAAPELALVAAPASAAAPTEAPSARALNGAAPSRGVEATVAPLAPAAASAAAREEEPAAPEASVAPPAPSARPSLGEEMAVIDEARRSLAAGDAQGALGALDRYARLFPAGRFGQEATFLRIDALMRRGDRAGAQALARGFLASHPRSPLADRVRKLTGLDGDD